MIDYVGKEELAVDIVFDHGCGSYTLKVVAGVNGIDTLQEIKKLHPLVEVIMLTGHANVEAAMQGLKLGAFDYLMKPVDLEELLYKLQDAYKKRQIEIAKTKNSKE